MLRGYQKRKKKDKADGVTISHVWVKRKRAFPMLFLFLQTYFYLFINLGLFRAVPPAYGGSQDRGLIGAVATGLRHSHSNAKSKPHL